MIKIVGFIWLENIVEKITIKHSVLPEEVEELFIGKLKVKKMNKGHFQGEDVYRVLGQNDLLPDNFSSFESFWEFWDTHSSADYEDLMETVELNVELSSRNINRNFS